MSCDPTPTATRFATVTSTNIITTVSDSIQTESPTQSTILETSCLSSVSGLCLATTVVTDVTAIPGDTETVQVPVFITQTVFQTVPTLTLFAPCTGTGTGTTSTPSPSGTDSATSAPPLSASPTPSLSSPSPTSNFQSPPSPVVTPSPTITSASGVIIQPISTAIVSGSTVIVYTTIATSRSASSAVTSGVGANGNVPQPQGQPASNSSDLAPVLGGTLGGFFFLLGIVGLIWFLVHRHKRRLEIWEDSESVYPRPSVIRRRKKPDVTAEPKPYVYGLVGRTSSLGVHSTSSPPGSPAPSTSLNHLSRAPSATLNGRPESTTGLLAPSSFPTLSPTPTPSRAGSPQGQPRQTHADEFGVRPTSVHDERERRLSHGAFAQLGVHIPSSPATDYFGLLGNTAAAEPRSHTTDSADSGLATPLNPERRELHVVNTPLSPASTAEVLPPRPKRSSIHLGVS